MFYFKALHGSLPNLSVKKYTVARISANNVNLLPLIKYAKTQL
jgi:hypothetical protein